MKLATDTNRDEKLSKQQPAPTKGEWKVIEPELAKEYVIVNDGEENIYIGKNKEKAVKMCKAVNMHDELVSALKKMVDERGFRGEPRNNFVLSFEEKVLDLLKQAEQK